MLNEGSSSESSDGAKYIVEDSMSDLEFPVGLFSDDHKGELYVMCHLWAHNACAGADKDMDLYPKLLPRLLQPVHVVGYSSVHSRPVLLGATVSPGHQARQNEPSWNNTHSDMARGPPESPPQASTPPSSTPAHTMLSKMSWCRPPYTSDLRHVARSRRDTAATCSDCDWLSTSSASEQQRSRVNLMTFRLTVLRAPACHQAPCALFALSRLLWETDGPHDDPLLHRQSPRFTFPEFGVDEHVLDPEALLVLVSLLYEVFSHHNPELVCLLVLQTVRGGHDEARAHHGPPAMVLELPLVRAGTRRMEPRCLQPPLAQVCQSRRADGTRPWCHTLTPPPSCQSLSPPGTWGSLRCDDIIYTPSILKDGSTTLMDYTDYTMTNLISCIIVKPCREAVTNYSTLSHMGGRADTDSSLILYGLHNGGEGEVRDNNLKEEVHSHLRGGRVETRLGKPPSVHPNGIELQSSHLQQSSPTRYPRVRPPGSEMGF
uniref:Uncharacterized protein n=1 Tax=Timema poppense TaxID=170557 RepID=A0A7R9CPK8_TIMPO|nr:unnamed protein product [Timema poppensis]